LIAGGLGILRDLRERRALLSGSLQSHGAAKILERVFRVEGFQSGAIVDADDGLVDVGSAAALGEYFRRSGEECDDGDQQCRHRCGPIEQARSKCGASIESNLYVTNRIFWVEHNQGSQDIIRANGVERESSYSAGDAGLSRVPAVAVLGSAEQMGAPVPRG
jgi:hypothetical protein